MSTAKQIFNYIQGINPRTSTVSSIGTFVTAQSEQVAEMVLREVINALPEGSLAYKIATGNHARFSEKQIWVIAFELSKNEDFSRKVSAFYDKITKASNAKEAASKAKIAANKEASSDVLSQVKAAGRKLADYYAFLKKSKPFAREFYSKNFSQESVNSFLAL